VAKSFRSCSLQAVYLELKHLTEAGVVIKIKDRFDLSIVWVCKLFEFSNRLSEVYFAGPSTLFAIPDVGQKVVLNFSDPKWADLFWMQCVSKLVAVSKSKQMFQWVPHPWHRLIMPRVSQEFESVFRHVQARDYIIVGGATYLDRQAFKEWPRDLYEYSAVKGPFHSDRSSYMTLIGEMILIQRYQARFIKEVDAYFDRITAASQVKGSDLFQIFGQKTPVRVTLEHNAAKAETLRRKFKRYFGLK
jgi:hypothetical protein